MSEMLNVVVTGEPTANPPLLIAHGLFGTARNWGVLAKRFSPLRQVIAVDMRNHGDSFNADTNSYFDMAADLAQVIAAHGPVDVIGHSMGGKAAMVLALNHPDLVNRLIVADIAPVGYAHSQSDKIDAMLGVDLSKVTRRRDADLQLNAHIDDPMLRAFLLQSLSLDPDGPASWKLNLPVLKSAMAEIIGFPTVTGQFKGQVLFLQGGTSDYVKPEYTPLIQHHFPNTTFDEIAGAGHWLHAEKPREFETAVNAFLG